MHPVTKIIIPTASSFKVTYWVLPPAKAVISAWKFLEIRRRIDVLTVRRYLVSDLNRARFMSEVKLLLWTSLRACACAHVWFTAPYSLGRESESIKNPLVSTGACTLSFVQSSDRGDEENLKQTHVHKQHTLPASSIDISYFLIWPPAAEGETFVWQCCLFLIKMSLQRAKGFSFNAVSVFVVVPYSS